MKQEMITYIFGDVPLWKVGINMVVGTAGLLFPYMYWAMTRDPHNNRTPVKFSFKVFFAENALSIISRLFFLSVLLVILVPYWGLDVNPAVALLIGIMLPIIIRELMNKLPAIAQNLLPSLFTTKTQYKVTTEYVFKIPVGSTAVKVGEEEVSIEAAAEHFAATVDGDEFVIQEDTPDTLEFIVGGVSHFVGHVPRPK